MTKPLREHPEGVTAQRLLAAQDPGLEAHHARFGRVPVGATRNLISAVGEAGLTGRGGAGFPTARKLASVRSRMCAVVANGAEGEPLSHKDATLLRRAPHLVLDGLQLAADALGADEAYLYLPRDLAPSAHSALEERRVDGCDRRRVTVVHAVDGFIAGEESAVLRRIAGGPGLPRDRLVPVSTSGLGGRPTLVNNVETLAHVALIAPYGPTWFRSMGDTDAPGSMLITVSRPVGRPTVLEVPTGARLKDVLARWGATDPQTVRAVLIGGYHGTWLPIAACADARLSRTGLAASGAGPGAGIVHVLPVDACGLARTADIITYLAEQSARQCGPCRNGLPLLGRLFDDLAYGHVDDALLDEIDRLLALVTGRGACRHPDGTARLGSSALSAFARDIAEHRAGRCEAVVGAGREYGDPT